MYIYILIAGFGGGVLRGLVGFIKHQYSYKNVKFQIPYFLAMMFISGIVGLLTAFYFNLTESSPQLFSFSTAITLVNLLPLLKL